MEELLAAYHRSDKLTEFDISEWGYKLSVEQLRDLRITYPLMRWVNPLCELEDLMRNLEFQLEISEWITDESIKVHDWKKIEDQVLTQLANRGVKISFGILDRFYLYDILTYVAKHRAARVPIIVNYLADNPLTSYCELIDYPIERIKNQYPVSPLINHLLHREDNNPRELNKILTNLYEYNWTCESLYFLLTLYSNYDRDKYFTLLINLDDDRDKYFTLLVNLDDEMKYCTKSCFDNDWLNIIEHDGAITNRRAIEFLYKSKYGIWDTNKLMKYNNPVRGNLYKEYKRTDITEKFDYLKELIEVLDKDNWSIGIIIRLLKRRIIDLTPYEGSHPVVDHLLQFQHRPMVKSAANRK